jgi:hypothetical protein
MEHFLKTAKNSGVDKQIVLSTGPVKFLKNKPNEPHENETTFQC